MTINVERFSVDCTTDGVAGASTGFCVSGWWRPAAKKKNISAEKKKLSTTVKTGPSRANSSEISIVKFERRFFCELTQFFF